MPATKITGLAALVSVDGAADFLPIVDVSDVTMAATGTTKKLLPNNLPVSTAVQAALDLKQTADADLTSIAALATTAYGRDFLTRIDAASARTYIGAGTGFGDALIANPLSQFAATTSLQLLGVISDETGTGALVFATSPTLITPALGVPSAVVLTNATGNAAGLTAGTVTTNANLSGHVTSVGNSAVLGAFTLAQLSTAVSDADVASVAYADSLVVGLLDDRGNYNASVNTFPAAGGSGAAGAILKGDLWTVSVAGTLGGAAVTAGDLVRAIVDTPGQTASNWAISETNIGYVALNAALANGTFYVGNGSGIGTAVSMSGAVTMSNAGVVSLGSFTIAQLSTAISDADLGTLATQSSVTLSQVSDFDTSAERIAVLAADFATLPTTEPTTIGTLWRDGGVITLTIEDPDWGAFRIAAGITDATQKTAGNNLVLSLKSGGFWPRMVAVYPFLGGTAASHKWNLKDPRDLDAAKRLTFDLTVGSITHSSNGALTAGGAFAKTFVDWNLDIPAYSHSWGFYNRTAATPSVDEILMGQGTAFAGPHIDIYSTNFIDASLAQQTTAGGPNPTNVSGVASYLGLIGSSSYGFNHVSIYRNATALVTNATTRWGYWSDSTPASNRQSYLWASNGNGTAQNKATRQCAFAFIGYGMTAAQWTSLNTIITDYQTALGRNV